MPQVANIEKIRAKAEKDISEIVKDDESWNLFVQQAKQHEFKILSREKASSLDWYKSVLIPLYITSSMIKVCDSCDYSPNHRKGQRKFSERKRFDCNWRKTEGDILAEQTAKNEGLNGGLYSFNDPEWKTRYNELSKKVLEEHTDRTKAPQWLDAAKNLCPHYYMDLTKA